MYTLSRIKDIEIDFIKEIQQLNGTYKNKNVKNVANLRDYQLFIKLTNSQLYYSPPFILLIFLEYFLRGERSFNIFFMDIKKLKYIHVRYFIVKCIRAPN